MRDIRLTFKLNMADMREVRSLVSQSIGPAGECIMLLVDEADVAVVKGYDEQTGASFPHSHAERPVTGIVVVVDENYIQRTVIADLKLAHPILQPLPDGNLLLVGPRCRRFPDGTAERNAHVFSGDGELQREMTLGDGIEDVQTTTNGDIWVSYFDEGVFGNYGWGGRAGSHPIGASGLVRFDFEGRKLMEFLPPSGFGPIIDCYALNLYSKEAWVYYYTDFPLVRISVSGETRGWNTTVQYAHAFATDGRRVLLFGGYGEHRERCVLGELGKSDLMNVAECRLVLPSGEACSGAQVIGRGPFLHVFTDTGWYQADVRDLQ